jgi:FkbM family methyltransferase
LPHKVLDDTASIREALSLWSDDFSRQEFVHQVEWRLHGRFDLLSPPVPGEQYFLDEVIRLSDEEYFVDVGAYDGDTLRSFLDLRGDHFHRILALEPDPVTFPRLLSYLDSLPAGVRERIRAEPLAVGAGPGRVTFDSGRETSSAVREGGDIEVECVSLDDLLAGEAPTYLKFDIEGGEPEALRGAGRLIRGSRPAIAACVYHVQDHLWKIPLLLRELGDGYRFFLRPHMTECWETVCYALPPGR